MLRSSSNPTPVLNRITTSIGGLCVAATFLLMSGGVSAVRADSPAALAADPSANPVPVGETNMSIDPVLKAKLEARPAKPVAPIVSAQDKAAIERPGVAGYEVAPGVIVLNTQGFNYAPRAGSLDPKALAQEAAGQR